MGELGPLASFIANNGFAVFVAVYFMVVINRTLKDNTEALKRLAQVVEKCERRKE